MELVKQIDINRLKPNPLNPRTALATVELEESIKEQGVLTALLVCPNGEPGHYYVVDGHRRHQAALNVGLATVPCLVRDWDAQRQQEVILVSNLQRADLSPCEEARAFAQLKGMGYTQADIARRVGCSTARVSGRLVLLALDPQVQALIDRAEVPVAAASVLAKVADLPTQRRLATLAARKRLTVVELEELVTRNQGTLATERARPKATPAPTVTTVFDGKGPTRGQAIALLLAQPERTVTCQRVADLMDDICGVCADCGMSDIAAVCAECPLPKLASRLAE